MVSFSSSIAGDGDGAGSSFGSRQDGYYHCLIDAGALVTGMSNAEVASYLLRVRGGLKGMRGVVYLEPEADNRKMIMLRVRKNDGQLIEGGAVVGQGRKGASNRNHGVVVELTNDPLWSMELEGSGVPMCERFAFFDQVIIHLVVDLLLCHFVDS
jgi:hypothetical protein